MEKTSRILYLCNYDDYDNAFQLLTQPSGVTKINYIISVLNTIGYTVDVVTTAVSSSSVVVNKHVVHKGYGSLLYLRSFGRSSILRKALSKICVFFQIFIILLSLDKESKVLVYHSLPLTKVVRLARRFNKFTLYIEVEEIFSVLRHKATREIENEVSTIKGAAGYILVNDHLGGMCGLVSPSAVCYGNYQCSSVPKQFDKEGVVNILYAGGLDADAVLAIRAVSMLPDNFVLHILGYGTIEQTEHIMAMCNASELVKKKVKYHGCLHGKEYDDFISRCQIGLCSRAVETIDSLYAFPSKILAYLSHNLITVSTPLPAVVKSGVGNYVYFSEDYSENALSDAIKKAANAPKLIDNSTYISNLDVNFKEEMTNLLKSKKQ